MLVGVSVLIAVLASYAALNIATRVANATSTLGLTSWALIGSLAMGTGVWAMHFIGMLALSIPCGVYYDPYTTLLSMIPGIIASGVALALIRNTSSRRPVVLGSILLGLGIGTMHYTGMTAMRIPGFVGYDLRLFVISIIVAVLLAYVALTVKVHAKSAWSRDAMGAVIMGAAISGMHYTAMSASYFVRGESTNLPASVFSTDYLAFAVFIVTGLMVLLAISISAAWRNREIAERLQKSEERWKFALEGNGEGVWDWDVPAGKVFFSRQWKEMLGYDEDEIVVESVAEWEKFIHPDDKPKVMADLQTYFSGASHIYVNEHRCLCKDGSWKWVEDRGMIVSRTPDNKPLRLVGTYSDITPRKQAEESMQLASMVYLNSSEAMMVMDANGTIITINPAFTELTGYTLEEVVGKHTNILSSGDQDEAFHENLWKIVNTEGRWQGELWSRRKNGDIYAEWLSINTILKEDGTPHRRVALFSDITKKKEFEELIWKEANFDLLTGLPNRRMFLNKLEEEIKKAARLNYPFTLMFIDLDRFKEVNDALGHDMGDSLLKDAAQRLIACVRETDTVARMGGDEFTVILSGQSQQANIARVYEGILQAMSQPFVLNDEIAYVSASIGITIFPDDADTIEGLLKNADQAMYAAKNQGRNRYCYFTPAMQEAAQTRMRLANELRVAIAENQFRLVYQPIVELATGSIHKAEALIRWEHPVRGRVSPVEFIPVAEDMGLIMDIGNWVFHEAATQVKRLREQYEPRFQISVNKSPMQCQTDDDVHLDWIEKLGKLGLPGNSITIEITERILLAASAAITEKLAGFRSIGIQISLDDFGTGYSSLSYLKKFDIDYLKIDRSFICNLKPGSEDLALCEAIIVMAHKLGMKVIAEGVETEEQCDLLMEAGCDYAQGYLFSWPVSAEELEKMLDLPVFYIA